MALINIITAYFIQSPEFEIITEDGPGSDFNLQIVAETEAGTKYTHIKTFDRWEDARADCFVKQVEARGKIDPAFWTEGTSWDQYATPQTWEEEKAEHIFKYGAGA